MTEHDDPRSWDIIGPWAPELEGKTPPEGYQWTGEFRVPKDDEIVSHMLIGVRAGEPARGDPLCGGSQDRIRCEARESTAGRCWILIKL